MSTTSERGEKPARAGGSQTLARGLRALRIVADAPEPLTTQAVARELGVHRTIAHRVLSTLAEFELVTKESDGSYRSGPGVMGLARTYRSRLRERALPVLRRGAEDLGTTLSLISDEGGVAVAVAVVSPESGYHITFREGSRHPMNRGSAGLALRSMRPALPDDPEDVALARERGYATTHGQVEPGAYGLAVPIAPGDSGARLCVNLISFRSELVEGSRERMRELAEELGATLD